VNLLSIPAQTSEVDIAAVVREMSEGREIETIPLKEAPSMRSGVECRLDSGGTMEPLLEDQAHIVRVLRLVVGADRISLRSFRSIPRSEDDDASDPGFLPADAPLLIVSDFGLLQRRGRADWAMLDEWLDYCERQRRSGRRRIVGLLPVPARLWPASLLRTMALVYWDRTTSIRSVRGRLD